MTVPVPRVLLVEDDEGDALLVRECLREAGVADSDVIWRRTLSDGIAALAQRPACVLLDLGLPDAEGLGALQRLVAAGRGAVPVIVLTGRQGRAGVDAVAAGAQDYLVKDDITPELLDRSIRYAVERARAQRTELELRAEQIMSAENSRLERGLLPTPLLRTDRVACETYYQPGRNLAVLGGDFFDVVELPDGRVRAVIGDVMGHGPDEAALGVHLRVAWRTLVLAGAPDRHVLADLARLLAAETGGPAGASGSWSFVTACDITIDPGVDVTVRVAGHPAPLVTTPSSSNYVDVSVGPPLGIEGLLVTDGQWGENGGWPETRAPLAAGSSLVLYTDGLLDAYRLDTDASLGIDELREATERRVAAGDTVASWISTLVGEAPAQSVDDTAIVVLTVGG